MTHSVSQDITYKVIKKNTLYFLDKILILIDPTQPLISHLTQIFIKIRLVQSAILVILNMRMYLIES